MSSDLRVLFYEIVTKSNSLTVISSITIYNIIVDIVTVVGNVIEIDYAQ